MAVVKHQAKCLVQILAKAVGNKLHKFVYLSHSHAVLTLAEKVWLCSNVNPVNCNRN